MFFLSGCSLVPRTSSQSVGAGGVFRDSAYHDGNKAPDGLAPHTLKDASQSLDPLNLRTQADYYYSRGEAFSMEGQSQKAIESFRMVLVYDQKSAQVPLRLAAEYAKLGMLTQAIENAELAIEKNPSYVDARLVLGGLYSSLKAYEKALNQFEIAGKLDPKNPEVQLYLGAVYSEQKKYDEAIRVFEKLSTLEDFRGPHIAHYYIGRVRLDQNTKASISLAEKSFLRAIDLKGNHFESVAALGGLYKNRGQDEKTLKLFERYQKEHGPHSKMADILAQMYLEKENYAAAIDQLEILEQTSDESLNIKLKIAMILIQQKQFKPAIDRLQEIILLVPESDKIRFYLAAVHEELGQSDRALFHYKLIPSESQFFGEAVVQAVYILKKDNRFSEATRLVEPALVARPDLPQLYAIQASVFDEQNLLPQALAVLEQGNKKFPENVQLMFFLGSVLDRVGQKDESIKYMASVIEKDPNHVQALNYLAYTYSDLNRNLDTAYKLVSRALKLSPNDGYIWDTHGWILYQKGNYKDSVKSLERAFKLQPNEAIIAEHLGDVYSKLKVFHQARTMYTRAIELELEPSKRKVVQAKLESLNKQNFIGRTAASAPEVSPEQ